MQIFPMFCVNILLALSAFLPLLLGPTLGLQYLVKRNKKICEYIRVSSNANREAYDACATQAGRVFTSGSLEQRSPMKTLCRKEPACCCRRRIADDASSARNADEVLGTWRGRDVFFSGSRRPTPTPTSRQADSFFQLNAMSLHTKHRRALIKGNSGLWRVAQMSPSWRRTAPRR